MHDESVAPGLVDSTDEISHKVVAFDLVDTDAVFDGHRHGDCVAHRRHALCHTVRRLHQAGPECTPLHPLAGAAAIEVDFRVAPLLPQPGALRKFCWVATPELQGYGGFVFVMAQMAWNVAMQQSPRSDHFGIEQRTLGQEPVEMSAMPIRKVEHRRNTNSVVGSANGGCRHCKQA